MTITICTFNIRYGHADDGSDRWENRRAFLCDLWRSRGWDIVGVQEAYRNQLDFIRERLPEYAETGSGRDDGVSAGEHCAILFRADRFDLLASGTFWFSDAPESAGSRGWGSRHARICSWAHLQDRREGRSFRVYNLHIDHESQLARENSVDLLIGRVRARGDDVPVVVTGDFNAIADNPAIQRVTRPDSPFPVDTYAVARPDDARPFTFHQFTGTDVEGKIDYIFVSPEWSVDDAEIVRANVDGRYPSDHFPVTATLSLA